MNIGLIDLDSHNFPNLALMKISAYHKTQGDTVDWHFKFYRYDIVYISKVFTDTKDIDYPIYAERIIYGGTGYDLQNKLPDEIERMCPDYSLYPQFGESYGFLTRGCPRACRFCIVSEKEGRKSRQVADLADFHRGQRVIKLLDPNLLACKDRERLLQQLIDSRAWIDFTQGLDVRLIDKDTIGLMNRIKVKMIHFAWDNPKEDLTDKFIEFANHTTVKDGRKRRVYMLTNYDSTHEEDLHRIYTLQRLDYDPFIMIYNKATAPRETRLLQRWCNNKRVYHKIKKFNDFNPELA